MVSRSLSRAIVLAAACCVGLSGCSEDRTEILVVVDSDLRVPDELDRIEVFVLGPMGVMREATATLGPGQEPLPRTVGLVHETGPLGPLTITVMGRSAGVEIVRRQARLDFVKGRTLVLRMDLLRSCIGTTCEAGNTCTANGCRSTQIDPETLRDYDGEIGRIDGSTPPRDAGPGVDAGSDSGACMPTEEICNGVDDDCNGMVDEGFNLQNDSNNCGACGMVCMPPERNCCEGMCGRC